MKKLPLAGAMIALTTILTACPGPNTPTPSTYSLTVNLSGVASAPVKVTNTTTSTTLFDGTLSSGKTFSGIAAGTVLKVEGGAVNTFATPAAQTVTLDADKTVTLEYKANTAGSTRLDTQRIVGTVPTSFKLGDVEMFNTSFDYVAGSTVNSGNAVNFDLSSVAPKAADLTGNFTAGCQGQNSNPAAKLFTVPSLYAYSSEGDLVGYVNESATAGTGVTAGVSYVVRVYADTAVNFNGTCSRTDSSGKTVNDTFNINFKQGWNAVLVTPNAGVLNIVSAPADVQVSLTFVQAQQQVGAVLSSSTLTFTDNNPIMVDAAFIRVGGYNGTVNLSTDMPGLTVEPATVNLPALSTLSLGAQSYKTKLTFRFTGPQKQLNKPFTLLIKDASGQQVGSGTGTLVVNRPGVMLTFGTQTSVDVYQGESANVNVNVLASANFSGQTTVSLTNLPAGVTAPAGTVTVQGNGSATASIPLSASLSSTVGSYTIGVTSPDYTGAMGPTTLTVNVLPKRLALGNGAVNAMIRTIAGDLWGAGKAFVSVKGEQLASRTDLPNGDSALDVQLAQDGTPWARSSSNFYRLVGGTLQSFAAAGQARSVATGFGVDAQGRAWYMAFDGFNAPTLRTLDPATGTSTVWPTATGTTSAVSVINDATGQYVYYPNSEGRLVEVNTATGTSRTSDVLWLASVGEQVRFMQRDRQGNLWLVINGPASSLIRVNAADLSAAQKVGISTLASGEGYTKLAIEDATTAWFLSASATPATLIQMNLADGSQTRLPLGNIAVHSLSLAKDKGVAYTFGGDANPAAPATPEYLQFKP